MRYRIVPRPSGFLIVGRSIAAGCTHGIGVTLGVIVEQLDRIFVVVKHACGLYLISLGIMRWVSRGNSLGNTPARRGSWIASFSSGFPIAFGGPKAILLYRGLLPAFLDMATVVWVDVLIVVRPRR